MAISSLGDAVAALNDPDDAATQAASLRRLKSEVIGHNEKKEQLVGHGVVDAVTKVLSSADKARGKRKTGEATNGTHANNMHWSDESEVRLQAILLLGSLAHGGPPFVNPILSSNAISLLVSSLSPAENSPKIIIAALRTLLSLAEASRLVHPQCESLLEAPSNETLFSKDTAQLYAQILAQKSHSSTVQSQVCCLSQLISIACKNDQQAQTLVAGGVLDLLAARVAAFRANEPAWPVRHNRLPATLLLPPSTQALSHVLGAITVIIRDSKHRTARLLYSPAFLVIFPFFRPPVDSQQSGISLSTSMGQQIGHVENALPQLSGTKQNENGFSKNFPALGSVQPGSKSSSQPDLTAGVAEDASSAPRQVESLLVTWLYQVMRSHNGLLRVRAAGLLAELFWNGFVGSYRERGLALLVVPLLVGMLDNTPTTHKELTTKPDLAEAKELAPSILARFIYPNRALQKAAADANAIKKVSMAMRKTFEPVELHAPAWSAGSESPPKLDTPPTRSIGLNGLRPDLRHLFRCREGALNLVAAIAVKDDSYRKALTENGMVQCIIDSMKPFNQAVLTMFESTDQASRKHKFAVSELGNPIPVLRAACRAAGALSRSINLLRTSLIDAGLAAPSAALLKHHNVEVLKVATDVITNLNTDFSPMRQELVETGVVKILCEHAHSANSEIRLRSLWALKHLILKAPNDIKTSSFEELGTGWLIQIITGGNGNGNGTSTAKHKASTSALSMGAANAAGERIDILNSTDEPMTGVDDGQNGSDADKDGDVATSLLMPRGDGEKATAQTMEEHYKHIREIEHAEKVAAVRETVMTELCIQEQGLDFLRNYIVGPQAADMIDSLFQTLGANNIFDIVAGKLKTPSPHESVVSSNVVHSAIMILTHIAAGAPRHRQQLISQPTLLKSLLSLLTHQEAQVRIAVIWTINNLTWRDDQSDVGGARQRATELRKLGFDDKLKELLEDDNIDVRERASTGVEQIRTLLDPLGGNARSGR